MDRERPDEPWREPTSLVDASIPWATSVLSPWLRKHWVKLLVVCTGAAAVVVAGCLGLKAFDAQRDPVLVVEQYLTAIAQGDAAEANGILAPTAPLDESPLLSDEALDSAVERIKFEGAHLVESEGDNGGPASSAIVRATFSLAGEDYAHEFKLKARDRGLAGPDEWALVTPLIGVLDAESLGLGEGAPQLHITVGDVEVASSWNSKVTFGGGAAYPAVYEMTLDAGEYFKVVNTRMTVVPASEKELKEIEGFEERPDLFYTSTRAEPFEYSYSEKFNSDLLAQGKKLAEECAQGNMLVIHAGSGNVACPTTTMAVSVVDACLADPGAVGVRVGDWRTGCEGYRDHAPYRGAVTVEAVGKQVLTEAPSGLGKIIGPYRFTQVDNGTHEDIYLQYARFEWVDGHPVLNDGGFYKSDG